MPNSHVHGINENFHTMNTNNNITKYGNHLTVDLTPKEVRVENSSLE